MMMIDTRINLLAHGRLKWLRSGLLGMLGCMAGACLSPIHAQTKYRIQALPAPPQISIRGVSVVSDEVVWASGTGGQVGKSTDGGAHWQWTRVNGCDSCDWRSLHAFDDHKAIVLNAGSPALVFITEDGGRNWTEVFRDNRPGIFLDAMQFYNNKEGMAIGDPLDNKFIVIRTHNGGRSWTSDPSSALPDAVSGEALFAASGTSLVTFPDHTTYFATGGSKSRFFIQEGNNWKAYTIPMIQGSSTTGTFSIAFFDTNKGIAVGGDYRNDTARNGNCMLTYNGGRSWEAPAVAPGGYKSGVAWISPSLLITTGTSGTDISENGGRTWVPIGPGFNVVAKAKKGTRVYFAGKTLGVLVTN
jgi:photosystem II stability/assembly factor-like uncharacterized protein